jgi:hypothetical protein
MGVFLMQGLLVLFLCFNIELFLLMFFLDCWCFFSRFILFSGISLLHCKFISVRAVSWLQCEVPVRAISLQQCRVISVSAILDKSVELMVVFLSCNIELPLLVLFLYKNVLSSGSAVSPPEMYLWNKLTLVSSVSLHEMFLPLVQKCCFSTATYVESHLLVLFICWSVVTSVRSVSLRKSSYLS